MNVIACITAYKDQQAVSNLLDALDRQTHRIDRVLIVDNSPDPLRIPETANLPVETEHRPENVGIAGALHVAHRFARSLEADFLWTFDQDSLPDPSCLEFLLAKFHELDQNGVRIGTLAPKVTESRTGNPHPGGTFQRYCFRQLREPEFRNGYYTCDILIQSGMLIHLHVLGEADLPPQFFFIDAIDSMLCMNLNKKGLANVVVESATMLHDFGQPTLIERDGQPCTVHDYPPIRYFCINRNQTYLELTTSRGAMKLRSVAYRARKAVNFTRNVYSLDTTDKRNKYLSVWRGFAHGVFLAVRRRATAYVADIKA